MKKIFGVFIIFILFFAFTKNAEASTLGFNPTSSNLRIGDKIQVKLLLNIPAGESVWGYDAYIKFPSANLTYNSSEFVAGSVFATGGKTVKSVSGDYVSVGGYFDAIAQSTTTGGTVATLSFTGKTAGSGQIEIVCGNFTSIYSGGQTQNNLFTNCATLLPKSTFVISASSGGGSAQPTPTASAGEATPTTTSSSSSSSSSNPAQTAGVTELPETGAFDGMLRLIYIGIGMLVVGFLFTPGFIRITSGLLRIRKK